MPQAALLPASIRLALDVAFGFHASFGFGKKSGVILPRVSYEPIDDQLR